MIKQYVVISATTRSYFESQINQYAAQGYVCDMFNIYQDENGKPTYFMIMRLNN